MRLWIAALLFLQAKTELHPKFQKVDTIIVACKAQTEVKSSTGKDSKYTLELELSSEVEKVEGDAAQFACTVTRLKVSGRLDGSPVNYEWKKGGETTGAAIESIQKSLDKGWKATVSRKGISFNEGLYALGDTLPLFNPAVILGFCVPLPFEAVASGRGWEMKDQNHSFFGGFGVKYSATLNRVESDTASISARLVFSKADDEIPIETPGGVKGEGSATLDYDLKSGHPVKGTTSIRLTSTTGGQKREITQSLEFEARH
jgi:hypothetical protein